MLCIELLKPTEESAEERDMARQRANTEFGYVRELRWRLGRMKREDELCAPLAERLDVGSTRGEECLQLSVCQLSEKVSRSRTHAHPRH